MPKPTMNNMSTYNTYPDNDAVKEVFLQASGHETKSMETPRHVFLCWKNHEGTQATTADIDYYQILQLEKRGNTYHYCFPLVKARTLASANHHQTWSLGYFTRGQREDILEMAEDVDFVKGSLTEGCRVWTAKLLRKMAGQTMISVGLLAKIREEVPLPPLAD
jgi:hypothetical protein